jgi:ADP-ribosylglycohydrolase
MRISPLGIWARNLSDLEIEKAVRLEVSISHPNINLQDAAVAYVIALAEAVKTLGNKESAYMRAK